MTSKLCLNLQFEVYNFAVVWLLHASGNSLLKLVMGSAFDMLNLLSITKFWNAEFFVCDLRDVNTVTVMRERLRN